MVAFNSYKRNASNKPKKLRYPPVARRRLPGAVLGSGVLQQPQSSGCGSAMGMVCRTSSSNCRALCRWISIQQGVSLMLWRG